MFWIPFKTNYKFLYLQSIALFFCEPTLDYVLNKSIYQFQVMMGLATFGEWLVKGMEGALTLTNHVLTAVDGVIAIAGVITNGE